jgi:peptidylprolyl isomerase
MRSMKRFLRFAAATVAAAFVSVPGAMAADAAVPAGDKLVIELKTGKVVIKLRPDLAPKHVERYKTLGASTTASNGIA